jgi:4-hydroxy-tetrahydrodipicolinate reductase
MNIAIIGYGKMGKEVEKAAIERGHTISIIIDLNNQSDINPEKLKDTDVAIEFSSPDAAFNNILKCFDTDIPVVSGTTGWLDRMEEIRKDCLDHGKALFYAPNFSIGVNIFFKLNRELAKWMNKFRDYDVSIEEIHHIHKTDKPSGTAMAIADGITENYEPKTSWIVDPVENPSINQIPIFSKRESMVPGTHIIQWDSEIDSIELTHTAKSRKGFAYGAVIAAEFLKGKEGFYTMEDLMQL